MKLTKQFANNLQRGCIRLAFQKYILVLQITQCLYNSLLHNIVIIPKTWFPWQWIWMLRIEWRLTVHLLTDGADSFNAIVFICKLILSATWGTCHARMNDSYTPAQRILSGSNCCYTCLQLAVICWLSHDYMKEDPVVNL